MKVPFQLVKSFLRQALRSDGAWVTDPDDAINALSAIQANYYTEGTSDDTTTIASTVEGKTFQFQVTPGLSKSQVMAICEEAMELIESMQNANDELPVASRISDSEMVSRLRRKYLKRRSRTRTNFSNLQY